MNKPTRILHIMRMGDARMESDRPNLDALFHNGSLYLIAGLGDEETLTVTCTHGITRGSITDWGPGLHDWTEDRVSGLLGIVVTTADGAPTHFATLFEGASFTLEPVGMVRPSTIKKSFG